MVNIKETNLQFGDLSNRQCTDAIIIHHVGGVNRDVTAEEIHGWHLNQGWAGIGYHYVIRKDGTIERGRPEWAIGSHAYGENRHTIGINIVGDFAAYEPTQAQIESAAILSADISKRYGYTPKSPISIKGHRDYMATDCPGDNLYALLPDICGKAIWYMQQGGV